MLPPTGYWQNTTLCTVVLSVCVCVNVHSDWAHARSTSTVRDTEGLVQVEVRHIRAVVSRTAQPNLQREHKT